MNGLNPEDRVDAFFIIVNNGAGVTTGAFTNTILNQINIGGQPFTLNYTADFELNDPNSTSGNDVALVAVPEPGSAAILVGGFGAASGLRRRRSQAWPV